MLNLDARSFAGQLNSVAKRHFGAGRGPVILQLNSEGAEVDNIQAFHQVFGPRLEAVMGSSSDVARVKGQTALADLHAFLDANGFPCLPSHSDLGPWPAAAAKTLEVLEAQP